MAAVNAFNNIYANIVTAIVDSDLGFKTVDIDLGQLKKGGENIPYEEPAVLISIENTVWSYFDETRDIGVVHVRLKVIYPFTNEDENYTGIHFVRTEVDTFYQLISNVNFVVKNIVPSNFSKLFRINESHFLSEPEGMKWIHTLDYLCNVLSDDGDIGDPNTLIVDYGNIDSSNAILRRAIDAKGLK